MDPTKISPIFPPQSNTLYHFLPTFLFPILYYPHFSSKPNALLVQDMVIFFMGKASTIDSLLVNRI